MTVQKFFIPIIAILFISCKDDRNARAVDSLIKEKVEERLKDYERIRKEKCWEGVLTEASLIVDTILINEARASRDTLDRPSKPDKPGLPEILPVLDSTPVAPFLQPEQDSLGDNEY